jgi:hypothetical protein
MHRRSLLRHLLAGMGLIGFVAMGFVGLASLRPSARAQAAALMELPLEKIVPGEVLRLDGGVWGGDDILLLRPTDEQWQDLRALSPHMWDASCANYQPSIDAFVMKAQSTGRFPRELRVKPKERHPHRSDPQAMWLGGFVDDNYDYSYDFAGRAFREAEPSLTGLTTQVPRLCGLDLRWDGDTVSTRWKNDGQCAKPASMPVPCERVRR